MGDKAGIVYKITNKINGMAYIGKTKYSTPENRLIDHKHSNYYLGVDIEKYGDNNFIVTIIDNAETEKELSEKESYHIIKSNTLYPEGYNTTSAVSGPRGVSITNMDTGKVYGSSGEAERDSGVPASNITQVCKGTRNKAGGYRWSYTDVNYSGQTYRKTKPVINLDTKKIYPSIKDASEELLLQKSKITLVCQGKRKQTGGFRWAYYEGPLFDSIDTVLTAVKNIDTGKVFSSIAEAGREMGIDASGISKVCKGKRKTAGGYRWKYID